MRTPAAPARIDSGTRLGRLVACVGCSILLGLPASLTADEPVITAVAAQVSDDYVRQKLPQGKYAPESYAFGEGGIWGGGMRDSSLEKPNFTDIARIIAVPLAAQNYLPARDPQKTKLLIMVYWGLTAGTAGGSSSVAYQNLQASQSMTPPPPPPPTQAGPGSTAGRISVAAAGPSDNLLSQVSMQNRLRDKADAENAGLLGYDAEGVIGTDYGRNLALTPLGRRVHDLLEDLEENRYFVVLMAYDFPLLLKSKQHKLLWVTRFSIRQRGSEFDQQLAAMAQAASRYFGQDSHGLLRKPLPEEHVTLGELKIIGVEPEKK